MGILKNFVARLSSEKQCTPEVQRLGRNDPCWCGSGKKYKRCHIEIDRQKAGVKLTSACRTN